MKVLVTGGTGFVGSRVSQKASNMGWDVSVQHRNTVQVDKRFDFFQLDLGLETDWDDALCGVYCVIHCAARVHQMKEDEASAFKAYQRVNTEATIHLARQAVKSGVRRFIFLSSIKVNGESTGIGKAFTSKVDTAPLDPYGNSKYEAEIELQRLSKETGLDVVIIRPPLVYGPGVKANFRSMMKIVHTGVPLPFGCVKNARSLVYIDNLVDLILECVTNDKAGGQTFLVSDGKSVSTPEIFNAISSSMSKRYFMLPIPVHMLTLAASLLGKKAVMDRIAGNLEVDATDTFSRLNWQPSISFQEGIQRTVDHFLASKK
ncbi:UDP-glucose 4-epimerase family protein [Vibrio penaeicida]|uniref:UDP-glucose 4-epimerase n=1 Tax=Vibrio penaeicida TaxID=104609 RepID=A0AAV5NX41_9VIBR|nr:SDR family oxidoreductase [Vibrio penaeicida]RTZ22099.1 SDR family oxidoreductase [Vibrio penaeicida]GLQ74566.1 UDP-glucose 4-epimerase [Vibrio penaeicida]